MEKWTKEKAWEWYNSRPWILGFNFVPSNCADWVELWQTEGHGEIVEVSRRELAAAAQIGFNAVRLFLAFDVWQQQHDTFMAYVEEMISIAAENRLGVMLVPMSDIGMPGKTTVFGIKPEVPYHGAIIPRNTELPGVFPAVEPGVLPVLDTSMGYSPVDDPETEQQFYEYINEFAELYSKDERVILWNVWNEPGNCYRKTKSIPAIRRSFDIIRSHNPIQPLAADVWRFPKSNVLAEEEQIAIELSDVISYHDYGSLDHSVRVIEFLRSFGRPMLNTEWLHRIQNNTVHTHLPLYYNNGIGIFNWGLVAGKFHGIEPWEGCWRRYAAGEKLDLTKWQHDLLRPNLRPYDPEEIKKFMLYAGMADSAFAAKHG